ncbi:MAG: Glu/Leu/Phe/Val dehydrogenase [Acidimicrobiia bacterium]|nr:Glu/Leu/Phe/Val dehydrogenase [Acidimicrobiia bacterium]
MIEDRGAEQVTFCSDPVSGLRAVVAVHSTALGPALGGCRFQPYETELDAVDDVLRLAEGMTYKAALAGLDLGGGKAVILGDPGTDKSERLWRAFGRHIDSLGGRYVTAEDVGTDRADMDMIRRETRWVVGTSPAMGGADDPSPITAVGVHAAMKAAVAHHLDQPGLAGLHVAVQGVGKVGSALCHLLAADGCRLTIGDVNAAAARRVAATVPCEIADPADLLTLACDVLAPCALGGVLDDSGVDRLRARVVCGSANNQLVREDVADLLAKREILYAPDFVVNSGGLIHVAGELLGRDRRWAMDRVEAIGATARHIFEIAEAEAVSTALAAREIAEARIREISTLESIRRPAR